MINSVSITGRLTKDVELRFSPNGVAVARFTLAVTRFYDRENSDFIQIICFKKTAESVANHMRKGSLVGVTGRIQTSSWEKDGQRHYKTEVVADQIVFLEPKGSKSQDNTGNQGGGCADPFGGGDFEIPDSDMPF